MYLEKLEIQGFKSFANKNTLVFPGMIDKDKRGLTAIVGPNGSGKSNIADAIRWVLGEQSMKMLRGKRSEDVIFSGSDKKGKLSMSEVSLFLNNEDSAHGGAGQRAPIDYSQVILTRRIYRDGGSEYLLNNNRVRLVDVQILLAKANFGQKTYSVIGQGMVEGFLNTSLAERKEFFDEATGVKQFQIKRDESLNKLRASLENLNQAQMLLTEIEPHLKSLTRQMNKLQKRGEIEAELKKLQTVYYRKNWHEINDKFNEFNIQFLNLEKIKLEKDKKLDGLNKKLAQLEAEKEISAEFNEWQKELAELQNKKDAATKRLAKMEAELEIKLEASGKFDLSWLTNKVGELNKELKKLGEDAETAEKEMAARKEKIAKLIIKKEDTQAKIAELNKEIVAGGAAGGNEKTKKINIRLNSLIIRLEELGTEENVAKIKKIIAEIREDLKKIIALGEEKEEKNPAPFGHANDGGTGMFSPLSLIPAVELRDIRGRGGINLEKIRDDLNELIAGRESLSEKINETRIKLARGEERAKLIEEKRAQTKNELAELKNKLAKHENGAAAGEAGEKQNEIKKELAQTEEKISQIKEKIGAFSRRIEEKRSTLFDLQRNAQALQNEINRLTEQLNELKINSTRYETRLEDLEAEIRNALTGLKEIKQRRNEGNVDAAALKEKIDSLKRQLNLIGGIDPEIEKEYTDTKGKYDFLSGQTNDLEKSINSLEKVIKELDEVIKEKFDKEFRVISQKFEEYFKILFSGGNAEIIKVMAEEEKQNNPPAGETKNAGKEAEGEQIPNEIKNKNEESAMLKRIKFLQKYNATGLAGVEIQATPPGKKIKSIAMLSGGERALTAIALICAIISANPSPFMVLDEVDAALDEANSERLAKILDDLSHKTQFIVITHNRASMRRASILYGATMQDDGVSKLLSVRLEETNK